MKSLAVYCGHQMPNVKKYVGMTEKLGKLIAENNIRLVFGAGNVGLMGVVSRAVAENGGNVIGITIPEIARKQEPVVKGIKIEMKKNLAERKTRMEDLADAFCILPGGMGTLDEMANILTMNQVNKKKKPVFVLDVDGYWDPFGEMLERMHKAGFVDDIAQYNLLFFKTPERIIKEFLKNE